MPSRATVIRRHHGGKGCRGEGPPTPNHFTQGFRSCPTGASQHVFFPNARVGTGKCSRPGQTPPRHLSPGKVDSQTPNHPHYTYRNCP